MSVDPGDAAEKCGRFIRFALLPRLLPADDAEYLELVHAFLADAPFQEATTAFALGLGLRVLSVSTQAGLVLGTTRKVRFNFSGRTTMGACPRRIASCRG